MPRRSMSRVDAPCCYHVTHRCQERRFLLRFKQDRRRYLARLREAAGRYGLSVLNYMVTSNHVHLLPWAESPASVSAAMQDVARGRRDRAGPQSAQGAARRVLARPVPADAELTAPPARGRLIDRDRLLNCLECVTGPQFREWYEGTLRQECSRRQWAREPYWTEAAAVGGREWIEALASRLPVSWRTVELVPPGPTVGPLAEAAGT